MQAGTVCAGRQALFVHINPVHTAVHMAAIVIHWMNDAVSTTLGSVTVEAEQFVTKKHHDVITLWVRGLNP